MNKSQIVGSAKAGAGTVLRTRAVALARRPTEEASSETIELLEFSLARECLGIETRCVAEVMPLHELTRVPCTPAFVAGVVNVRGTITAVIDIQQFLGLPTRGVTDLHHVILVRCPGLQLGLLADTINGVHAHRLTSLQPAQTLLGSAQATHLKGITSSRVVVLDMDGLLADPKLTVQEEVSP